MEKGIQEAYNLIEKLTEYNISVIKEAIEIYIHTNEYQPENLIYAIEEYLKEGELYD